MASGANKMNSGILLAIGVHPDDIELCCAGTLLKHREMGYEIALLDLTRGELGTRGNAEIRLKEAAEAAKSMQVSERMNAGLKDGFFVHDEEILLKIIPFIRYYRPDIVLTNALRDRHPDHGRAAKLVADACFLSGLRKVVSKWYGDIQAHWRPRAVYHYLQDNMYIPDLVVDITPFFEKKMDLIRTYSSQFYDPDSSEPDSPISGLDFLQYIEAQDRIYGRYIQVEYAEAFQVSRPVGVHDLFQLQ